VRREGGVARCVRVEGLGRTQTRWSQYLAGTTLAASYHIFSGIECPLCTIFCTIFSPRWNTHIFSGSNVPKDKIWKNQARKAGACAKVEGCLRGLRAERGVYVWWE
jgi:hypothetical protein